MQGSGAPRLLVLWHRSPTGMMSRAPRRPVCTCGPPMMGFNVQCPAFLGPTVAPRFMPANLCQYWSFIAVLLMTSSFVLSPGLCLPAFCVPGRLADSAGREEAAPGVCAGNVRLGACSSARRHAWARCTRQEEQVLCLPAWAPSPLLCYEQALLPQRCRGVRG
ncbi:hypothetical protein NDU88_002161 [Pleurodeles waltl]|uniref:Uncharacterized protein n=1 Tax=Pleurodeles waltl TaxID=8319 RepID=A0AAV7V9S9_PLEWA|nr:hypothetical protein NDU88_002161 [Pleurodeles waltl]